MKTYILNILLIILLVLSVNISKAQQPDCPPGFNYVSFVAYWGPNQEPVTISFCYACTIGPAGVNILNVSITTSGQPTENFNDAFDATNHFTNEFSSWLTQQMLNKYLELCQIPPCTQPPLDPCLNVLETIAQNPICGKLIFFPKYQDKEGYWHYPQTFEMCSTDLGYCQIKIKNCRDYDHNGVIRSCSCEVVSSIANCPESPTIPPNVWETGYTTDCFQMNPYCGCSIK
jgi:hypothetical protein